jgi:FixJ family two-component response regulator
VDPTVHPGATALSSRHQPVSLLVVDDDIAIRELLVEYLTTRGYHVEGTSDGRIALDLLRNGTYHCVITDYQIPHVDGLTILRAARQVSPPLPTILMTGYGSVETAVAALKDGAADFLLKPFRLRRMHEAIAYALERSRQVRADNRLASTVALYDFAVCARTRWHLRPLYEQIAARLAGDLACDAVMLLAESIERGSLEAYSPEGSGESGEPGLLTGLHWPSLVASLDPGATLISSDIARFFPGAAGGGTTPCWLAARALMIELPGEPARVGGAVIVASASDPAGETEAGLTSLVRWATLAGAATSRVWTLDTAPGGAPDGPPNEA